MYNKKLVFGSTLTAVVGLPLVLYGCTTTPKPADVTTEAMRTRENLKSGYQFEVAQCDNPGNGGYASASDCKAAAFQRYIEAKAKVDEAEILALNENWSSARELHEEIERELVKKNKKWGIVLDENGVEIEVESTSGDNESPQGVPGQSGSNQAGSMVLGTTPIGDPIRLINKDWNWDGTINLLVDGELIETSLTGSIHGLVGQSGSFGMKGRLTGGQLVQTLPGGETVVYTIDTTESSSIVSDATTGSGYIDFVADADYPDDAWATVMQSSIWFRFPIIVDDQGQFVISTGFVSPESFYPYAPRAYTDYNLDGQWDMATDLSAFMSAWASSDLRADINIDGVWDQLDIDLWEVDFLQDQLNMQ